MARLVKAELSRIKMESCTQWFYEQMNKCVSLSAAGSAWPGGRGRGLGVEWEECEIGGVWSGRGGVWEE